MSAKPAERSRPGSRRSWFRTFLECLDRNGRRHLDPEDYKRLTPTRILLAPVTDRGGRAVGPHPVVMLVPPVENDPEATVEVACGSRDAPVAANVGFAIRVAGSRGPTGQPHPRTGLTSNTWFYAGWLRTIRLHEILKTLEVRPAARLRRTGANDPRVASTRRRASRSDINRHHPTKPAPHTFPRLASSRRAPDRV